MTVQISNTNLNDSFNTWRLNTNYMATVISNNVVTVSRSGSADRNAVSVGNGHIKGTFTANELATTTLRSGNTSSQGGLLTVVSNTLFNATTLTVAANTTFTGNVTFNSAGADRVNLGSVDRLIISGGTKGQFMRLSTQDDNPEFKSLTLRDITNLSSNASHIYLSGSNTTFSSNKDSTHLVFTGGDGDRIDVFLAADATLGDSDLFVKLTDASGDSRFVIADSANAAQFSVTSDGHVTVNRFTSDLIAETNSLYNLGSKDLGWSRAYANTVVYSNTIIHRTGTTETVVFGKNARLHVNNAISDSTIANAKLINDGITISGNTGTPGEVQLGDTLSVRSGTATGITVGYDSDVITISGVDASTTVKGVAKYNSDDFSVTSGTVSLADTASGAVLSIDGTANEVNVSRSNGTVTVGLTDSVSITSNLTVGGKVIGELTANGSVVNIGEDRTLLEEAQRINMYNNGGLSTLNVYANAVFHDNVTLTGGTVTTGNGIFTFVTVNNLTNLKGNVIMGDSPSDRISFNGRANTDLAPNSDNVYDLGTSALNWNDLFLKGKIAAGSTTIIGANQKLHANNTITNGTILNVHLQNDGITISGNTGTPGEVQLGDTLNVRSGTATGITVEYASDSITISGIDATSAIKGVAKFDSGDFTVSSGNVTLANSVNGAVLAISGTAKEVNVSRTNGIVTVGLPDDVTITSDLMVGGGVFISGNLTVSGTTTTVNTETINLADNIIKLNSNANTATAPSENAGIAVARGNQSNTQLLWNETSDRWTFTNNGTTFYNIPISTEYDNYGSWTARDHDGTTYTITSGDVLRFEEGNDIDVNFTGDDELTFSHVNISRTNTTNGNTAPGFGSSFTAIDSITSNARGHITDVNTKTVTVANTVATTTAFGLIKLGSDTTQSVAPNAVSSTASRSYAVQLNSSKRAVVNVPWTDTTYSAATLSTLGLMKLGSSTTQTIAANSPTAVAGRSYAVQFNSSQQALVNVPWTDTTYSQNFSVASGGVNLNLVAGGSGSGISAVNIVGSGSTTVTRTDANTVTISSTGTTYSAGAGLDLTGTTFSIETDLRGEVTSIGTDLGNYYVSSSSTHAWYLSGALDMRLDNSGNLDVDGEITALSTVTSSDARLKTNIRKVENALEKIEQIVGVEFEWIEDGTQSAGVIAQDVEKVLPCAVTEKAELNGEEVYKKVNYNALFSLVIESIKELKKEIEELKANK